MIISIFKRKKKVPMDSKTKDPQTLIMGPTGGSKPKNVTSSTAKGTDPQTLIMKPRGSKQGSAAMDPASKNKRGNSHACSRGSTIDSYDDLTWVRLFPTLLLQLLLFLLCLISFFLVFLCQ